MELSENKVPQDLMASQFIHDFPFHESKVEAGMLLLIALLYIVEVYYSLLLHCNSSDLHTCLISTYLLLSVTV